METVTIGIGKLRGLRAKDLRELRDILLVTEVDPPKLLVAVIPYKEYLRMQALVIKANECIEELSTRTHG